MITHFESLAQKAKTPHGSPISVGPAEKVHQYETLPVGVGETKIEDGKKPGRDRREDVQREGEGRQGPSLEDISKLRPTAQQNYMEAISAAEERYEQGPRLCRKPKNHQVKEWTMLFKEFRREVSILPNSGALKDAAVEKGHHAKYYTSQKAVEAKDSISSKGGALKETAVGKGQQAKDYTVGAKDAVASTGQSATGYAADKAKAAKDTTVNTTKNVASYVGDRAPTAKDATLEGGKGAAGYAGKVAERQRIRLLRLVGGGGGATHYTLENVAETTKAVAGVTSSVAGYTGEKTLASKDKVAGAGQTVLGRNWRLLRMRWWQVKKMRESMQVGRK